MHAIRERRFGKVPPFVARFFIGFGRSERKYAFSALGNTQKSTFSNFCELFAPRLLLYLHRTVKSMQNLYFFMVPSNIHPTTQMRGQYPCVFDMIASHLHTKIQISNIQNLDFVNKIDLPNFRSCVNNWRHHSGGSFAIFEHAPLLLPTANCSPPTFCEFPWGKNPYITENSDEITQIAITKGKPRANFPRFFRSDISTSIFVADRDVPSVPPAPSWR